MQLKAVRRADRPRIWSASRWCTSGGRSWPRHHRGRPDRLPAFAGTAGRHGRSTGSRARSPRWASRRPLDLVLPRFLRARRDDAAAVALRRRARHPGQTSSSASILGISFSAVPAEPDRERDRPHGLPARPHRRLLQVAWSRSSAACAACSYAEQLERRSATPRRRLVVCIVSSHPRRRLVVSSLCRSSCRDLSLTARRRTSTARISVRDLTMTYGDFVLMRGLLRTSAAATCSSSWAAAAAARAVCCATSAYYWRAEAKAQITSAGRSNHQRAEPERRDRAAARGHYLPAGRAGLDERSPIGHADRRCTNCRRTEIPRVACAPEAPRVGLRGFEGLPVADLGRHAEGEAPGTRPCAGALTRRSMFFDEPSAGARPGQLTCGSSTTLILALRDSTGLGRGSSSRTWLASSIFTVAGDSR